MNRNSTTGSYKEQCLMKRLGGSGINIIHGTESSKTETICLQGKQKCIK
jgi:hypothetical protein